MFVMAWLSTDFAFVRLVLLVGLGLRDIGRRRLAGIG